MALDGQYISMNDFMLSNYKLAYSHDVTGEDNSKQTVFSVVGTDVSMVFDSEKVGEEYEYVCRIY